MEEYNNNEAAIDNRVPPIGFDEESAGYTNS